MRRKRTIRKPLKTRYTRKKGTPLLPAVVKAEGGRVRRKSVDVNSIIKNKLLVMIAEGNSLTTSLKELNLNYSRYNKWMNRDIEFKRKVSMAREGRCHVLHEKFYELNVRPIAEADYHGMDEFDLDLHNKRTGVISKSQSILTAFKKEDAPQLYNKDLNQLNVETMNNMNFNINLDQLKKVVGAFKPEVIEGEIVTSKTRDES